MPESPKAGQIRPDIQALRALAIVSVVLYHLWPNHIKSGFIGVDIFFVISGFLITGQLWREVEATSQVRFSQFWARRARRLLPASLLVIFITSAGVLLFVPPVIFSNLVSEAIGATTYVQNWVLASKATDYLQGNTDQSPFLHFWSLSVEEQFYVFWPLILGLLLLVRKPVRLKSKPVVLFGLSAIFVASLFLSIELTQSSPELAYFSTFTRAWEFAGGALLAVIFNGKTLSRHLKAALLWLGLAVLVFGFLRFNAHTSFPGYWAAIPTAGAMLFLLGGDSRSFLAPSWLFRFWPVKFLGDISYSLYLWHWPLIVLAPWVLKQNLTTTDRQGILVLAIVLAFLSKRFIEDPIRFGWLSRQTIGKQLTAAGLAMAVVVLALIGGGTYARGQLDSGWSAKSLHPSLSKLAKDYPAIEHTVCRVQKNDFAFSSCVRGDKKGKVRIALFGDSHARQYFDPIEALALKHHWQLTVASKSACPLEDADTMPRAMAHSSCVSWNRKLEEFIASQPRFDLIINSTSSYVTGAFAEASAPYVKEVKRLVAGGNHWLVIRDNPKPLTNFVACIEASGQSSSSECSLSRKHALNPPDRLAPAVRGLTGVSYLDLTDAYCSSTSCSPVIGDIVVYRDESHISATFSKTLESRLEKAITDALTAARNPKG